MRPACGTVVTVTGLLPKVRAKAVPLVFKVMDTNLPFDNPERSDVVPSVERSIGFSFMRFSVLVHYEVGLGGSKVARRELVKLPPA